MSTDPTSRRSTQGRTPAWATGLASLAGILMITAGGWGVITGITAIVNDELYLESPDYLYSFDLTAWGWVHLVLGALILVSGVAVLRGSEWARVIALVLAGLSVLVNFMFIPYYPLWSVVVIAVDVLVIYALLTHLRSA